MERSAFIDRIASQLGRKPMTTAPVRDVRGVPDFYAVEPYGVSEAVDRVDRFVEELKALGGEATIVADFAAAGSALRELLRELSATEIVTWDRSEFEDWGIDWLWDDLAAKSWQLPAGDRNADALAELKEAARNAHAGITLTNFAVANTGTLVHETSAARPRSVSLLPTTHIALIRESQIVDRMGQAMESYSRWEVEDVPSSIHFISGPSRSSDIENDLTIGVHGPVAVVVIIVRDVNPHLALMAEHKSS